MSRFIIITAAFGLLLSLGCRHTHLGTDTGVAYENAFEKQRDGDGATPAPELSAADAKQVVHEHRGGSAADNAATSIVTPIPLMTTTSGGSAGRGAWQGAAGNIVLEAK